MNPQVTLTLVPNVSTTASVNFITPAASLAVGGTASFAVDAAGNVRAWGFDSLGMLGDGTTAVMSHPLPIASSVVGQVTRIGAGNDHACAVTAAGALECWGLNADGELGDGTTVSPRLTPVQPFASGVARVSSGGVHTCALKTDGTVWCTGSNGSGQLGNGTTAPSLTFGQVFTGTVDQIAAGIIHTCARLINGGVSCWGSNSNGQLGIGTAGGNVLSPTTVGNLAGVAEVHTGYFHTCARKFDGTVWCWGFNGDGELGDGTTVDRALPVQVTGIFNAVQIAIGETHSCALLQDGSVQCWGNDLNGELGDGSGGGSISKVLTPVPVRNLTSAVVEIASHPISFLTCARLDSGAVQCWGYNFFGAIGDGTFANAFVATTVAF
jgi:alpha-tubulin suppressor-like RCC1 family protein